MSDAIPTVFGLLLFGGFGFMIWTCTDGYHERVRMRRAKNWIWT